MSEVQKAFLPGRSLWPALDVRSRNKMKNVVAATGGITQVTAYKLGGLLAEKFGLINIVPEIRGLSNARIIFDRQKGATDIPDVGAEFAANYAGEPDVDEINEEADAVEAMRVDALIVFPQSGPATAEAWINALIERGVTVFVGGMMTHPKFLRRDGGWIVDEAPTEIFDLAVNLGVRNFIVPGNKPEIVAPLRDRLIEKIGSEDFTLGAPGFVTQLGDISETGKVAGNNWGAIVGSGIYKKTTVEEMREAAFQLAAKL